MKLVTITQTFVFGLDIDPDDTVSVENAIDKAQMTPSVWLKIEGTSTATETVEDIEAVNADKVWIVFQDLKGNVYAQ